MIRSTRKDLWGCHLLAALLLGVGLGGSPPPVRAQEEPVSKETIQEATSSLAVDLASSLRANAQSEVVLGRIDLQGVENTLALPLAKALEGQKIKIIPEASGAGKWRISGEASAAKLPGGGIHVAIECKLRPPLGLAPRKVLRYLVTSSEDIRKISGVTATVPVGTEAEQSKKLAADIEVPKFNAEKRGAVPDAKDTVTITPNPSAVSLISAVGTPQYKVEMLIQRGGKGLYEPLAVTLPEGQPQAGVISGQPVVALKPDDNYALRVVNGSDRGAGVEISIDGINLFNFCDIPEWKREGKIYFHPGQAATVTGWYFPRNQTRTFKVVNEEDSLHRQLGRPRSSVGVITVRFCAAWSDKEAPPADEREFARGGIATGIGELDLKAAGFRAADTRKFFGVPRAQVSVRYSRPDDLPPDLPGKAR